MNAAGADAEQRQVARRNPLLQLFALRLREPAGRDGRVDPVLERLLDRGLDLRRVETELLRHVGDDRVALLRRRELVGGDRGAAAEHGGQCHRAAYDLELEVLLHQTAPLASALTLPVDQGVLSAP